MMIKNKIMLGLLSTVLLASPLGAKAQSASGVVASIVKAPIAPDGDVAGAVTDFAINLSVDMDPAIPGKTLAVGESIRITMPEEFRLMKGDAYPVRDLFSAKDCRPGLLKCTTGVLLHGWPQHPILPSFPPGKKQQYSFTYDDASNTIIYTAKVNIDGVPLPGPGIKQIHPMLFGFKNPDQPGSYPIRVGFYDAEGNETESGVGYVEILAKIAPSINIVSTFVPGDKNGGKPPNPNIIYQTTKVGQPTPMPWDFLLWDGDGKAFEGVVLKQLSDTAGTLSYQGKTVGTFAVSAPLGASGQSIKAGPSVTIPGTPIIGKSFGAPIPAGRLTARFTAGTKPGRYFTTFTLIGGNSATMVVDVVK